MEWIEAKDLIAVYSVRVCSGAEQIYIFSGLSTQLITP